MAQICGGSIVVGGRMPVAQMVQIRACLSRMSLKIWHERVGNDLCKYIATANPLENPLWLILVLGFKMLWNDECCHLFRGFYAFMGR